MIRTVLLTPLLILLSGCAGMIAASTGKFAGDLSASILNQSDLQTVREGAPAYLLLLDGLIEGNPENRQMLVSGARLYGAYASVFVKDSQRAQGMTEKAYEYATRALCLDQAGLCAARTRPFAEFDHSLKSVSRRDIPVLYTFTTAWAAWIQTHSGDWSAVADLPKVEASMRRVVELDEAYDHGNPRVFLGVLTTLRPAALGGKPEEGKAHFLRAIELSAGRNLMAKVQYAGGYARLVFDRELHDQLLNEVLAADAREPGLTLINTVAKQRARELLRSANDYF